MNCKPLGVQKGTTWWHAHNTTLNWPKRIGSGIYTPLGDHKKKVLKKNAKGVGNDIKGLFPGDWVFDSPGLKQIAGYSRLIRTFGSVLRRLAVNVATVLPWKRSSSLGWLKKWGWDSSVGWTGKQKKNVIDINSFPTCIVARWQSPNRKYKKSAKNRYNSHSSHKVNSNKSQTKLGKNLHEFETMANLQFMSVHNCLFGDFC